MKKYLVLVILIFLLSMCLPCVVSAETSASLTMKGDELLSAGKYQEALNAYNESIALESNNARAWAGQGYVYNALSNFSAALVSLEHAISISPNYGKATLEKGNALFGLKRYDEAIKAYEDAVKIYPEYAYLGYYGEARSFQALQKYNEALPLYEKALTFKPDYAPGWNFKGETLVALNRSSEATTAFDKAISLSPGYLLAMQNKNNVTGQSVTTTPIPPAAMATKVQVTTGQRTTTTTNQQTPIPSRTKAPLSEGLALISIVILSGAMILLRRSR
jgi:tetratricopeptide (TPR) repeat protein